MVAHIDFAFFTLQERCTLIIYHIKCRFSYLLGEVNYDKFRISSARLSYLVGDVNYCVRSYRVCNFYYAREANYDNLLTSSARFLTWQERSTIVVAHIEFAFLLCKRGVL